MQMPLLPMKRFALHPRELAILKEIYKRLYSKAELRQVSCFCDSFNHLLFAGTRYKADKVHDYHA